MNNKRILIFAGTYEGRLLCEQLNKLGIKATACVTTTYGLELTAALPNITVYCKKLDQPEMSDLIKDKQFEIIIDATHPYAQKATENIKAACLATQTNYSRLLREENHYPDITTVSTSEAAAAVLENTQGNILLTTGSKELAAFCTLTGFKERLFARVLPSVQVLTQCENLGLAGRQIIAMQGPFSVELNLAMLQELNCKYLVTKNTGIAGGVQEKISAAQKANCQVIMINRPVKESGYSLRQVLHLLSSNN